MHKYKVVITQSVQKYLRKIPDNLADTIESEMLNLENDPRPFGYIKLKGRMLTE